MSELKPLRLLAEEAEDLEIISAAVQDAVVKAENLNYEARIRRFSLEINRYRWEEGVTNSSSPDRRSIFAPQAVSFSSSRSKPRSRW